MRDFLTKLYKAGDFWGGFAAMLVALPASIAFGVTIYAAISPTYADAELFEGLLVGKCDAREQRGIEQELDGQLLALGVLQHVAAAVLRDDPTGIGQELRRFAQVLALVLRRVVQRVGIFGGEDFRRQLVLQRVEKRQLRL